MNSDPASDKALMVRSEALMARNCCSVKAMVRMVERPAVPPLMMFEDGERPSKRVKLALNYLNCALMQNRDVCVRIWIGRGRQGWPPRFLAGPAGCRSLWTVQRPWSRVVAYDAGRRRCESTAYPQRG
jgi:hypothetical protein